MLSGFPALGRGSCSSQSYTAMFGILPQLFLDCPGSRSPVDVLRSPVSGAIGLAFC